MGQREFAEILSRVLGERGKGEHILAMNDLAEAPADIGECSLSINGKVVEIKIPIAMRTPDEVRADILAKLPDR